MAKSDIEINKLDLKLHGRIVHKVPMSFLNKPKPSDKPTKVLLVEDDKQQSNNNIPVEQKDFFDNSDIPGTTVLGLSFDDEDEYDANVEKEQESENPNEELVSSVLFNKPADSKSTDNRTADSNPTDKKLANSKSTDNKSADSKLANNRSADGKSTDNKFTDSNSVNDKLSDNKTASNKSTNKNSTNKTSAVDKQKISHVLKSRTSRNAELKLIRKYNNEEIKITKKDFVIGKSKYSDFQVKGNNTVSRSHVIVHKQPNGSLKIEDNNSKNGTFIDEVRIDAHEVVDLKDGQSVRMSNEIFTVKRL